MSTESRRMEDEVATRPNESAEPTPALESDDFITWPAPPLPPTSTNPPPTERSVPPAPVIPSGLDGVLQETELE